MSPQYTLQQVVTHNQNHPNNKWAVIHGDVYRISSIPFNTCTITPATVEGQMNSAGSPDVSGLFAGVHKDGNTMRTLQRAQGCHLGTIAQAPAGTQQDQPGNGGPAGRPGHQGHNGQGQNGQGQNGQGHNGQPDDDDEEDDGGTAAERRRREEARNRRLRKTYNPLVQDPDDADEYPADAVAMGYLPDLEGRRWREKRMRLSRFIQFNDLPAIDEEDLDPLTKEWLDLDFAKEIRYQRNLKGGEAKGCTGSFRVARPPPPRSQLRPRDFNRRRGGRGQPPPSDPPDSDASSSDDDDDAPGPAALSARQVQVEGRVRQWFPSNSNRTRPGPTHLATPPVTPHNHRVQQTTQEPPPPPPQDPNQRTPEEERRITQDRQNREWAAADKAIRKKQQKPADVKASMDKLFPIKNNNKASRPGQGTQGIIQKTGVEKQPLPPKPSEGQKKQEEERKKRAEAEAEQQRQRDRAAQKKADDERRQAQEQEEQRLRKDGNKMLKDATKATEEQRKNLKVPEEAADAGDKTSRSTHEAAEQQKQRARELYKKQQDKIKNFMDEGDTRLGAQAKVSANERLLEDPDEGSQGNKSTNTTPEIPRTPATRTPRTRTATTHARTPAAAVKSTATTPENTPASTLKGTKRPAETTKEAETPVKKIRSDETPETKKDQAGGKSGGGGAYSNKSRPSFSTERKKAPQNKEGWVGTDERDDDFESPDELAPVSNAGTKGKEAVRPANPPRPALPDLPADLLTGRTVGGGTSGNTYLAEIRRKEKLIPSPAGGSTGTSTTVRPTNTTGQPTDTANTTTSAKRASRSPSPEYGLPPGTELPPDIQEMMDGAQARQKSKRSPGQSGTSGQ